LYLCIFVSFTHTRSPLGGANAYMFYRFFCFSFWFFFRPQKYETTVLGWTDFHETYQTIRGENVVFNVVPKWGLGPPNNFLGAKNWKIAKNRWFVHWWWPVRYKSWVSLVRYYWQLANPGCQLARLLAGSGCVKKAWARECIYSSCLFVSLLARLRENGWTDLHETFREGAEWPRDDVVQFLVNSGETARCCDANFFVSNITSKPLNRFACNFQGRCGVTMGWPDYIFGQFRETARCRDAQHGDGVCCAFAPQLVL